MYEEVPEYNFEEKFHAFEFTSLLTRPEIFTALSRVKEECNKVSAMSLFQIPITKSMRAEEFEQSQSQATAQVRTLFLNSHTPSSIIVYH